MRTHLRSFCGLLSLLVVGIDAQDSPIVQPGEWDRYRRQALPVEHLQIHSTQSNITINDQVIRALSAESIINLDKEPYNATLFSRQSDTQFDSNATFVRINAVSMDFALAFQRMIFRSMANTGDVRLETRVNPQQSNQSVLRLRLSDNVQFGITDEQSLLRIISSNATQVVFSASTEQQVLPRQLQLGYDNKSDVFRILFAEQQARVSVEITRSILHLNYGNIFIQMDNNFRRLIILTSGHRLEFHTLGSQFQVQFDAERMAIHYPHDNVTVRAGSNSNNVTVDVRNFSKMDIHRTNDSVVLLASNSHQIEVIGNQPFIMATTENVALVITSTIDQGALVPNVSVPVVDYSKYNLQNLTQLDTIASNTTWLTSKIDINNLIGEEIIPIDGFSRILGAETVSFNGSLPQPTVSTGPATTLAPLMPLTFPPEIGPQPANTPATPPEIPSDFPTPPPIENAIAETGFPMPPLVTDPNTGQVPNNGMEGIPPMQVTPAAQGDGQNDNFIIGQYETPPSNGFPLSATIVTVSIVPTTPVPAV
ncbi:hypothetical protein M3Y99_01923600 [Aphelenchoides fujianensis]|nr:hypothetical protein M3Y99_01923600 [Aphelenchoides fujianensis]